MKIIVLQHIACETPGFISDLMLKDKVEITTVQLDEGGKIPDDLSIFDGMFCMGGPMDTWMEKDYPWLIEEKNKIKEFVVELKKPFLGFCLGCQLLGEAIGGKITNSLPPEVGMLDINLFNEKKSDKIFNDFPNILRALQWHSYEVTGLEDNNNVTLIGSSSSTKYQIFKYKEHAYGIQFHIEIKDNTVRDWSHVPEYKNALENILGKGALEKFDIQAKQNMKQMNNLASILYKNFTKLI